jgi:hypothetical protein
MAQRIDQHTAAFGVIEQIVLQIGVALHHPNITQHLVQHACGTPRAALGAQTLQSLPRGLAQQSDHDFSVRETGVVVRDFSQAGRRIVSLQEVLECGGCVHEILANFTSEGQSRTAGGGTQKYYY